MLPPHSSGNVSTMSGPNRSGPRQPAQDEQQERRPDGQEQRPRQQPDGCQRLQEGGRVEVRALLAHRAGRVRGGHGHGPVGASVLARTVAVGVEGLGREGHHDHQADREHDAGRDQQPPQSDHPVIGHGRVSSPERRPTTDPAAAGDPGGRCSAAGSARRCTSASTSTWRAPSAGSGSGEWAYLPSRMAVMRPLTPSAMRSMATFANVNATIVSTASGSPERRS